MDWASARVTHEVGLTFLCSETDRKPPRIAERANPERSPTLSGDYGCQGTLQILTTISALGRQQEVYMIQCSKCWVTDMYIVKDGKLQRF